MIVDLSRRPTQTDKKKPTTNEMKKDEDGKILDLMSKEEDGKISNVRDTGEMKGTSEAKRHTGTSQNLSLCKHLGEDVVCVPLSVMSDLIEKKITFLLRLFQNKKQTP